MFPLFQVCPVVPMSHVRCVSEKLARTVLDAKTPVSSQGRFGDWWIIQEQFVPWLKHMALGDCTVDSVFGKPTSEFCSVWWVTDVGFSWLFCDVGMDGPEVMEMILR